MLVASVASLMIRTNPASAPKLRQWNTSWSRGPSRVGKQHRSEHRGESQRRSRTSTDTEALLLFADEVIVPNQEVADRVREIDKQGLSTFDALHLASAEQAARRSS